MCRLYIYGGHDIREGSLDNLWMIDLDHLEDLEVPPEDQEHLCQWEML